MGSFIHVHLFTIVIAQSNGTSNVILMRPKDISKLTSNLKVIYSHGNENNLKASIDLETDFSVNFF